MQINDTNLALLYRGFNVLFTQGMDAETPVSDKFTLTIPSSAKIEEYDWLNSVPGMKALNDELEADNLSASQWTISNQEWADFVKVKQWDVENDKYGLYNTLMTNLGVAATMHKDELCFPLLYNGFTQRCYTGGYFFSANQKRSPRDAGFSNLLTAPLDPHGYAFMSARANLVGRKNSSGRPMNLGQKLALVVGPDLEPVARSIVSNDLLIQAVVNASGDVVAAANQNNVNKGLAEVVMSPYVPTGNWFLLEIGKPVKPVIWQLNKKPVLLAQTSEAQSDYVFEKHEFRYQAYGRYNAGYGLSELAVGSQGGGAALTQYP